MHCDSVHVGRTSQQLEERIPQHIPKFIKIQVKPQKDLDVNVNLLKMHLFYFLLWVNIC